MSSERFKPPNSRKPPKKPYTLPKSNFPQFRAGCKIHSSIRLFDLYTVLHSLGRSFASCRTCQLCAPIRSRYSRIVSKAVIENFIDLQVSVFHLAA
jgi:hypothetical protein